MQLLSKAKSLYGEISSAFHRIEEKSSSIGCEPYDMSELQNYMMDLKDLLIKEKDDYNVSSDLGKVIVMDIFVNYLNYLH